MTTPATTTFETHVGRTLAPEDLRPGDLVSVLTEIIELPSFVWWHD